MKAFASRWLRAKPRSLNRRAFLRGAAGVTIGLPFLEGLPWRSAWAQEAEPRFAFFVGTANGVVQPRFWPSETGETVMDLSMDANAAGALAGYERWISFCQGFRYPGNVIGDSHASSYSQTLTGAPPEGAGNQVTSTAPSIDTILAPFLNPDGTEPMCLYAGMKHGYIDERFSFIAAGQIRPAEGNPFQVYQDLLQAGTIDPEAAPAVDAALQEKLLRRETALDFVRDDLSTLLGQSRLSAADRQRLESHLDSLRDLELGLADMPTAGTEVCDGSSLDVARISATAETYRENDLIEEVAELQMHLTAFAFACNLNHVSTLQHGDGQDNTVYDVPSNERGWRFHFISHRTQSDGAVGNDPLAEVAHAEIDRLRLETFARGLARFEQHGLLDKTVVLWANQFADGPSASFVNLPLILAGSAGGMLRTGVQLQRDSMVQYMNGQLLNTIAHALGVDQQIGVTEGLVEALLVS